VIKEFTVILNTPHRIRVETRSGWWSMKLYLQVDGREMLSKEITPTDFALEDNFRFILDGKDCNLQLRYGAGLCICDLFIDGKPQF
jgi:hypothetical protein